MTDAYIKTSDLRPGIVISEDIFVNTSHAIVRKNTVLLPEHLDVLNAFDVKEVKVEEQLVVKGRKNWTRKKVRSILTKFLLEYQ